VLNFAKHLGFIWKSFRLRSKHLSQRRLTKLQMLDIKCLQTDIALHNPGDVKLH